MTTHIPAKFKTRFLSQLEIDEMLGKDVEDIVEHVVELVEKRVEEIKAAQSSADACEKAS